jgi:hypothetical protein
VRISAGDLAAAERDAPGARLLDARDGADERGLAGAVGADDGHDLALGHVERDRRERLRVAVVEIEVADLEHRRHSSVSSPR